MLLSPKPEPHPEHSLAKLPTRDNSKGGLGSPPTRPQPVWKPRVQHKIPEDVVLHLSGFPAASRGKRGAVVFALLFAQVTALPTLTLTRILT